MMSTLRQCCCNVGGPAVFISIGPDEDSAAGYADTIEKGDCNPFCCMDEDIIHPVVNADEYGINNEFVYEEEEDGQTVRKVRIGLELLLRPCFRPYGQFGCDYANPPDPPQCLSLPFERIDYERDGLGGCGCQPQFGIISQVVDMIETRFGPQVLGENSDGSPIANPYPEQIYFCIDTSGSHTWNQGAPIVQGIYDEFVSRFGQKIANSKFNPCLDGPDCSSWGCCSQQECPSSYCYTQTGIRRFTFEMTSENYMSSLMDLMTIHYAGAHCDVEKVSACGLSDCYSCSQCSGSYVCAECLGLT